MQGKDHQLRPLRHQLLINEVKKEGVNMVTSSNPTITRKTIINTKTGINTCIFHTSILSVDIHHSSLNNSSNILDNFQSLWAITFFYPFIVFYLPEDANVGFSQVQQRVLVSMNVYVLKHSRVVKLKNATSFFLVHP